MALARGVRRVSGHLNSGDGQGPIPSNRWHLWGKSLLAIYDVEALVELDIPWWTFDAIAQVEEFLSEREDASVFEWGAGASTVWLACRAARVTSVEHDARWAEALQPLVPANAVIDVVPPVAGPSSQPRVASAKKGYEHLDFSDYVAAIDRFTGVFDLIVVDGRARGECLRRATERLAPGGMILLDNVERVRYRRSIAALRRDAHVRWTCGLTPCLPYPTLTALITLPES